MTYKVHAIGSRSRSATLAVVACGLLALPAAPALAAPVGDCVAADGWPASRAAPAAAVVELVNAHRSSLGLAPVGVSPTLTAAAVWKARHMAAYRYFGHDDPAPPVARTWAERARACGYRTDALVGENIAEGARTAPEVMAGWLDSPGHRRNIEAPGFAAIGVGVAQRSDGIDLWVQVFGSVLDAAAPPALPLPPASPPPAGDAVAPVPHPTVTVASCRRAKDTRRVVRCRVVVNALTVPARLRGRLVRRARTAAQGSVRVHASGSVRLRLKGRRPLAPGRYRLVVRLGDARRRSVVRLGPGHGHDRHAGRRAADSARRAPG